MLGLSFWRDKKKRGATLNWKIKVGSLRVIKILSNCSIDTGPSVNAGFSVYLFVEQRSPVRTALFAHADTYTRYDGKAPVGTGVVYFSIKN